MKPNGTGPVSMCGQCLILPVWFLARPLGMKANEPLRGALTFR
jgi:hypothetical protein